MRNGILFFLVFLLYSSGSILVSFAGQQASASAANTPAAPGVPAQVSDSKGAGDSNMQEIEKLFKDEEEILKKIKDIKNRQERDQRLEKTEQTYQEALSLYYQRSLGHAKEVLGNVHDLMGYYKSTREFLRSIDKLNAMESKRKSRKRLEVEDPQLAAALAEKSSKLAHQAAILGDDSATAGVENKLTKLTVTLQHMYKQAYIQQQMDKIVDEAGYFDQKIFRLTQSGDYSAAEQKYAEFQQVMIKDLTQLRQTMARLEKQ
jgi:hypothetical protein